MKAKGNSISKTFVWIILALVILGLGGFGAVNLSGNVRNIGQVGDKAIPVDQYARELQQQIRDIEQQTGQPMNFQQAQAIGLDRAVLQRIVRQRALDNETDQLGLSIGDESLRERILDISAFQGIDGSFDREGYRFALQQAGISESEFETSLREEAARTLLQGAIASGITMPQAYAQTLVDYVAQRRSFTWARLGSDALETPIGTPTDEDLRGFYDENTDLFSLPASKQITYAILTPDDLLDEVEVSEDALREAYDARASEYKQPERRLVERLVFADEEAANQAAAALEVDGTTFETLVQGRGLSLADVDLGDVGRLELDAAGEAVFNAEVGDVVGPLPSNLGPALFRINGVLPAQNVSFEDAEEELRGLTANDNAQRLVAAMARDLDDQLAGGATLEQMADETRMTLGTIAWTEDSTDGIAAYGNFREAAAALSESDFPKIIELEDGSVFAMRLDSSLPERPEPFAEARADVVEAWTAEKTIEALSAQAETLRAQIADGTPFADVGLDPQTVTDRVRNGFVEGTPDDTLTEVFDMAEGDVRIVAGDDAVFLVQLDAIAAPDADAQSQALREQLGEQLNQQLAQDVFNIYAAEVVQRSEPTVNQQAINAVHVNFP
jgi:peptidyl-prolyl cis-trans isomerase D